MILNFGQNIAASQAYALELLPLNGPEWAALNPEERTQITMTVSPRLANSELVAQVAKVTTSLGDILRQAGAGNAQAKDPLQIVFCGILQQEPRAWLHQFVPAETSEPIILRRHAWGAQKHAVVTNTDGVLTFKLQNVPEGEPASITALDMASDDWTRVGAGDDIPDEMRDYDESLDPDEEERECP